MFCSSSIKKKNKHVFILRRIDPNAAVKNQQIQAFYNFFLNSVKAMKFVTEFFWRRTKFKPDPKNSRECSFDLWIKYDSARHGWHAYMISLSLFFFIPRKNSIEAGKHGE